MKNCQKMAFLQPKSAQAQAKDSAQSNGQPRPAEPTTRTPPADRPASGRHQHRLRHVAVRDWTASARVSCWRHPLMPACVSRLWFRLTRECRSRACQESGVRLTRAPCDWGSICFDQNQPILQPLRWRHVAVRYLVWKIVFLPPLTLLNCILALFPTL